MAASAQPGTVQGNLLKMRDNGNSPPTSVCMSPFDSANACPEMDTPSGTLQTLQAGCRAWRVFPQLFLFTLLWRDGTKIRGPLTVGSGQSSGTL
jgi:hypothetical protein